MRVALAVLLSGSLAVWCQELGERRKVSAPLAFYDDADVSTPGAANVSEYFSYVKVPAGRDASFPCTYFSLGLTKRISVSGGFSYARSLFEGIPVNGAGDADLGVKLLVVPESKRRPALALKPMVEILGKASIADNPLAPDRVNYILPFVLQKSSDYYRVYYMAGYVTRGIIFNSLAFEWNGWSRVTPIAIVSASRLTRELGLISEFGLNRSRSDIVAGAAVSLRPGWSVFANTGRSFGRLDLNSSCYQVTFGLSFNVRLWRTK